MPRFHFKLQKVLEYRKQLEETAKLELSRAQKQYRVQSQHIQDIDARIDAMNQEFQGVVAISEGEIWLWRTYRERLIFDRKEAESVLQNLAEQVANLRKKTVERSRERKLLERLKTRQLMQHRNQEQTKEQQQFDEMATIRFQHSDRQDLP